MKFIPCTRHMRSPKHYHPVANNGRRVTSRGGGAYGGQRVHVVPLILLRFVYMQLREKPCSLKIVSN